MLAIYIFSVKMYIASIEMCIFRLKTKLIPYVSPPHAMAQAV